MNRFVTKEGGQPIFLEDLDFMQDSVVANISELITSLAGTDNCILSGCEIIDDYKITGGTILFNGEILPFPGKTLYDSTDYYLRRETNYLNGGERTLKNGSVVQCYERVSVAAVTTPTAVKLVDYYKSGEEHFHLALPHIHDLLHVSKKVMDQIRPNSLIQVYKSGSRLELRGKVIIPANQEYETIELEEWPSNLTVPGTWSCLGSFSSVDTRTATVTFFNSLSLQISVSESSPVEDYVYFQMILSN